MKALNEDCGSKIVKILNRTKKPVDVSVLVSKIGVNKTTVYRQIEKLLSQSIIIEVELGDGKKRYELMSLDHHHHLLCKICGKLEDIKLNEKQLLNEVAKKSNFKVDSHNLEFFGRCINCK